MFNKIFGFLKRKKKVKIIGASVDNGYITNKKIEKEVKKTSNSRTLSSEFPKAKKPRIKRKNFAKVKKRTVSSHQQNAYKRDLLFDERNDYCDSFPVTHIGPSIITSAKHYSETPAIVDDKNDKHDCKHCTNLSCSNNNADTSIDSSTDNDSFDSDD